MFAALTNFNKLSAVCLWLLLSLSLPTLALPEDSQQPIKISADSAIRDEKQGTTIYQGNVDMTQGTLRIQADKITIYANANTIETIIAIGQPARFRQQPEPDKGDVVANANTIEYRVAQEIMTLTSNAAINQDGASISGDSIKYDIAAGRIEAGKSESGTGDSGRVNVVLPPTAPQPE